MKLLAGAFAYLAVVAAVIVAVLAGMSSIDRRQPAVTTGAATPAVGPEARRALALSEAPADPKRVPVWIAATPKYEYTPQPIDARPNHTLIIGMDARKAMAKAPNPLRKTERSAEAAPSSRGVVNSRRDNDPFFRD